MTLQPDHSTAAAGVWASWLTAYARWNLHNGDKRATKQVRNLLANVDV
jgi:uncharacterized membrane protein